MSLMKTTDHKPCWLRLANLKSTGCRFWTTEALFWLVMITGTRFCGWIARL